MKKPSMSENLRCTSRRAKVESVYPGVRFTRLRDRKMMILIEREGPILEVHFPEAKVESVYPGVALTIHVVIGRSSY